MSHFWRVQLTAWPLNVSVFVSVTHFFESANVLSAANSEAKINGTARKNILRIAPTSQKPSQLLETHLVEFVSLLSFNTPAKCHHSSGLLSKQPEDQNKRRTSSLHKFARLPNFLAEVASQIRTRRLSKGCRKCAYDPCVYRKPYPR